MTHFKPRLTPGPLIAAALSLCALGTACSSSSDNDDDQLPANDTGSGPQMPVDDMASNDNMSEGGATPPIAQLASYCTAPDFDSDNPAYVLFDLPAYEQFDELRSESDSLEDLSVLTQIASLASDNQAVPDSLLFCDYDNAEANGCTMSVVPRSTVRDVLLMGSTLSFSVDTDDGQTTDYVIGNRDYSTASLASTTRIGSVFTLDTSRDSTNVERVQINRSGRTTVVTENPDCSGSLNISEGMTSTLTAEWTSPTESVLSLTYELCETGAPEGSSCATGSLTVR